MKRSEWIKIAGIATVLFVSVVGSALYISFKIGGAMSGWKRLRTTCNA